MKKDLEKLIEMARNESAIFNAEELLNSGLSKSIDPTQPSTLKPKFTFKTILISAAAVLVSLFIIDTAIEKSSRRSNATSTATVSHPSNSQSHDASDSMPSIDKHNSDPSNSLIQSNDQDPDKAIAESVSGNESSTNDRQSPSTFMSASLQNMKGDVNKLLKIQSLPAQVYTVNTNKDTILKLDKGTLIHLESYCFRDSGGKVVSGNVEFKAKECYSLTDMVHENLSTQSADGLLETGGMFYTAAFQNGKSLQLRPGYELGLTPNYLVPERMDFYNGAFNQQADIVWTKDPLGKTPNPIIVVVGGKFETVLDTFFYKNFRFEKSEMLQLLDSTFLGHFTSQDRQVIGQRSCDDQVDAYRTACNFFNDQLAHRLAKMSAFPPQSRMTVFKFMCMSKNKYAYAMSKGYVDSFVNYIPPSDYNYLDLSLPLFYSGQLGALNIDCVPDINLSLKWKKLNKPKKNDLTFEIPNQLSTNSFLILKDINAIARASNSQNNQLTFTSIEEDHEALLVVTSLYNDEFYVYSETFNTKEVHALPKVIFRKIGDADEYNRWLESTVSGKSE